MIVRGENKKIKNFNPREEWRWRKDVLWGNSWPDASAETFVCGNAGRVSRRSGEHAAGTDGDGWKG